MLPVNIYKRIHYLKKQKGEGDGARVTDQTLELKDKTQRRVNEKKESDVVRKHKKKIKEKEKRDIKKRIKRKV